MKVKDSPLYKTLCKAVREEDHAELLRMLEMVPKSSLTSRCLPAAFTLQNTPQGDTYWRELSHRLRVAGHDCY